VLFDETQKERGKIHTNYSMLRDALKAEGYEVNAYDDYPIQESGLKGEILVFACPDGSKLQKHEVETVVNFVEKGGGLLVISNAGGDRGLRTNMNEILNKFGIEILSDQVKDNSNNEFNMPTHPIINDMKDHPITRGISEIVIVAGCSVRGSSKMQSLALTSNKAEPPSGPVVVAGEHKNGRVVAIGSYRLFSNYGAGLSLRDNKQFAMNIFKWLGKQKISAASAASTTQKDDSKSTTIIRGSASTKTTSTPPKSSTTTVKSAPSKPTTTPPKRQPSQVPSTKPSSIETKKHTTIKEKPRTASTSQPVRTTPNKATTSSTNTEQAIESLRAEMAEMRDIIARLYSDSLAYLQEMKEEVHTMLDYIRSKEG
jgi:uncharacterized membrane protein